MISSLELARQCGISQGTVDRALHNRPGVSPKTREKILRAAERLGYRPHPAARELLTGRSQTVGIILPAVNNIFFMDLFAELARSLSRQQVRLQFSLVENRGDFLETLEDFAARRHRLALVIPPEDNIPVPRTLAAAVPIVSLISPCRGPGLQFLSPDETETGREAVRYLHRQGHQRILHLTYDRPAYAISARTAGYKEQCREMALPVKILKGGEAEDLGPALRSFRPTALFCHNDWMALRAQSVLSEMGLRVPDDLSVIGVDNSPTLMSVRPGLTTLAYPLGKMVEAVEAILGGQPAALANATYQLIERTSVRKLSTNAVR